MEGRPLAYATAASVIMLAVALIAIPVGLGADAKSGWQSLVPGMDLRYLTAHTPSTVGDSRIAVLRIDPVLWELVVVSTSQTGEAAGHTAREWWEKQKLMAAINAGIFETDQKTQIGDPRFG